MDHTERYNSIESWFSSKIKPLYDLFTLDEILMTESRKSFFKKRHKHWYSVYFNGCAEGRIPYNLTNEMKNNPLKLLLSILMSCIYPDFSNENYIANLLVHGINRKDYQLLMILLGCADYRPSFDKLVIGDIRDHEFNNNRRYKENIISKVTVILKSEYVFTLNKVKNEQERSEIIEFLMNYCYIKSDLYALSNLIIKAYNNLHTLLKSDFANNKDLQLTIYEKDIMQGIQKIKNEKEIKELADILLEDPYLCAICNDNKINTLLLPCRHTFCKKCITSWLFLKNSCPNCRTDIKSSIDMII